MKYLLDTNIWIYIDHGDDKIIKKVSDVLPENCFMSEITVAELKFGAECSDRKEETMNKVNRLLEKFAVIPVSHSIEIYAKEQASLKKTGEILEKFDALIAATAIVHKLTLVTNDIAFSRLEKLKIENWASHRLVIPIKSLVKQSKH